VDVPAELDSPATIAAAERDPSFRAVHDGPRRISATSSGISWVYGKSDARSSYSVNSISNPARRDRRGSRHCVRNSYGIDGGSHRRESYAAGSGVAQSNTEELPPLGTVTQDPSTLDAGVVSTSGIHLRAQ